MTVGYRVDSSLASIYRLLYTHETNRPPATLKIESDKMKEEKAQFLIRAVMKANACFLLKMLY